MTDTLLEDFWGPDTLAIYSTRLDADGEETLLATASVTVYTGKVQSEYTVKITGACRPAELPRVQARCFEFIQERLAHYGR
ncbi:MAG: hypothetical protein RBT75_20825 [Anaerolineae bacterium]|jgi:hypothetical protein|nr:hypothetical protein [Anaerolineae bacterium]